MRPWRLDLARLQTPPPQSVSASLPALESPQNKERGPSPTSGKGSMILAAVASSVQSQRGNSGRDISGFFSGLTFDGFYADGKPRAAGLGNRRAGPSRPSSES